MNERGKIVTVGTKSVEAMAEESWGEIDRRSKAEAVPPGWKTADQKATEWGIARNAADFRLRAMARKGILEMRPFYVEDVRGNLRKTNHFKPTTRK